MITDIDSACAALVARKDRDAANVLPDSWLRWALPPCPQVLYNPRTSTPQTVASRFVMSSTRHGWLEHPVGPMKALELMARSDEMVTDDLRTRAQTPHQARIGSLPIYCACEAKNRVALFKSANRPMRAYVTLLEFPEARSMLLIRTWPHRTWQIRWGHNIADVPCEQSLNVLLAYGVRTRRGYSIELFAPRRMKRNGRRMLSQEAD
jgi:hypothetical protein